MVVFENEAFRAVKEILSGGLFGGEFVVRAGTVEDGGVAV
jgi:hypothetical protein